MPSSPTALRLRHHPDRLFHLIPRRDVVRRTAQEPDVEFVGDSWIMRRRHGVEWFIKPPYPTFSDELNVPHKSTVLVADVLRVIRLPPFHIHPLQVLVDAILIAFSYSPFVLTVVFFEEPLYTFCPRAFELFRGSLQGLSQVSIARLSTQSRPRVFSLEPLRMQLRCYLFGRTPTPRSMLAPDREC